jgi:hypothetical protein
MENNFYKDLCKKEAILVEKLRVLREFKAQFFTETGEDIALDAEVKKAPSTPISSNNGSKKAKKPKRTMAKRGSETIPEKIKNSLKQIDEGKTNDIANKMIEIYPEYKSNPEKAKKDARHYISKMSQNKEVEVIEIGEGSAGNTYKYKE